MTQNGTLRRNAIVVTAVALLYLSAGRLDAADLLPPTLPDGVGLNVQWNQWGPITDFQGLGVGMIRTHLYWGSVEYGEPSGVYHYGVERSWGYDSLYGQTTDAGLRNFITLSLGSNDPGTYGVDRATETWQNGFAAFAGDVARHYYSDKGYTGNIYEICNEPQNDGNGLRDPSVYASLVRKAYTTIKAADPTSIVVAGSTTNINSWAGNNYDNGVYWLGQCAANGMLNYCDAVSVHPYNGLDNPEMFPLRYGAVRGVMQTYGKILPLVTSEWGISTVQVSEQVQADYMARYYLVNLSQNIPISIGFDWKDHDSQNWYETMGVTRPIDPVTPKPAYYAIQTMTRSLQGEVFSEKLDVGNSSDWLLVFRNPDTGFETLAAWTTGESHVISVNGWGDLTLTASPQYVNPVPEPSASTLTMGGAVCLLAYALCKPALARHNTQRH